MSNRIFFVRNPYALNISNYVASDLDSKENFLYFVNSDNKKYIEKMSLSVNNKYYDTIVQEDMFDFYTPKNGLFEKLKNISNKFLKIERFLNENQIKEIYINYALHTFERLIISAAMKLKIEINIIGEGTSLGFIKTLHKNYPLRIQISLLVYKLLLLKHTRFFFIKYKNFNFNKLYCIFDFEKDAYKFNEIVKINLKESLKLDNILHDGKFERFTLILSNSIFPASVESEIATYNKLKRKFGPIIIKFHPRYPLSRKNSIRYVSPSIFLPDNLENLSAEQLIINYRFRNVIGFSSTSMIFAVEYTQSSVYRLKLNDNFEKSKEYIAIERIIDKFYKNITNFELNNENLTWFLLN